MTRYLASASLVVLASAPALAQENPDETTAEIVVIGEGLPETPSTPAYATRTIERETIATTASGRIEDALSSVAGFQQFRRSDSRSSNPTAQGVTLRALGGNATSRALVTLDGVPMNDPFFGYTPFAALVPEQLSAIAVTRGGGSGPFGAGALAGTIAMQSAGPGDLGPVTASLLVNDRAETEAAATGLAELGAGFVTLTGRWDRGQGFFTTPEDQRVPATARAAFDARSGQIRAVFPVAETVDLQARVLAFEDNRTLRFDGADSSASGQDASVRLVGRGNWQFDALAYVQARNFSNVVISSTRFVKVLDQSNTPSTGLGGQLEVRPPVGPDNVLRLGVDYRRSEGELQEQPFSAFSGNLTARRRAGGTTTDLGLFAEHDWARGPLVLTGGIRADRTTVTGGFFRESDPAGRVVFENRFADRSDCTVTGRGGLVFEASDALSLRAAAYSGLRLPTLNELYRPFVVFPVFTSANAELENEELVGYEAGIDWRPASNVELTVTAFDNRVENAIANVTLTPTQRQRQNLPAIDAQGVEAGARITRGAWRFDGTIAYTDARIDGEGASLSLDGNRPPQTPEWTASATLSFEPRQGLKIAATLRHVGKQFESDDETGVLPAATTLGAFASFPLTDRLGLVFRAENIFDEEIVTRNANGAIDLGVPRTVWGGLRYGF
ncbi:TonB-dependent receptor [Altererythrobacter sp. MTPC7]|uniref:TonB-dependent receptor n=1 Tax=Altererythrobacter sp. MTPC7 TaxID=3056567 RepID=UPI0036F25F1C